MKMRCEVIQDLLPLYCDHQASQESCQLIEEHLQECNSCRKFYEAMVEIENPTKKDAKENLSELAPLKKIKRVTIIKIIIAVLVTIIVVLIPFYFIFIQGQRVNSEDVEIKISAFISNDEGVDYYDVQVSFNLKSGKCIDVRSDIINDSKGINEILKPYSQIKFPFDDRGDYPGYYSSDIEKDSPFTDEDIVVIQFKDKSVKYHLKDIAEKEGIQ